PGLGEGIEGRPDHVEGTGQVGVDVLAPLALGEALGAVDRVHDARVRDHRVTAAQLVDQLGYARVDGGAVANVEVVDITTRNLPSGSGQVVDDRLPQPACGA